MVAVYASQRPWMRHAPPVITRLEEIVSCVQGCVYVSVVDALDAYPTFPSRFHHEQRARPAAQTTRPPRAVHKDGVEALDPVPSVWYYAHGVSYGWAHEDSVRQV